MKSSLVVGLFVCLAVALVSIHHGNAAADHATAEATAAVDAPVFNPDAEKFGKKKCSFSSDCRYGKCKKGACGGCSFSSDCKGWGKCKKGWCGGCSFSSDCKGFGGCSKGRCKKSPY